MTNLVNSIENVHPGKYDLRMQESFEIEARYGHDIFKVISVAFKLGFARGQKAVKNA